MLALRRVSTPRGALGRLARQLCAPKGEPPKSWPVPRGFERFFPPSDGARTTVGADTTRTPPPPRPASEASVKRAGEASDSGSGGGEGGDGGGKGPKKDGEKSPYPTPAEVLVAAVGAMLLANALDWPRLLGLDSGSGARREISFQQFLTQVLPSGKVRRLVVVNGSQVRVYLGEYAANTPSSSSLDGTVSQQQQQTGGTQRQQQQLVADSPSLMRRRADGMGAVGVPPGEEEALSFVFSIGSVDQFEERLDAAQKDLGAEASQHVPVRYITATSTFNEVLRWAPTILVIGLMLFAYRNAAGAMGGMGGGAGQLFSVGKSKAKRAANVETRFKDVAGLQEAKAEVMEFVDFLKNPGKYTQLGARIPKGALLVGPPGCGKTLLARAVAGEAQRPFFSVSGSDFIEMFVGVGPARVRDMFAEARKAAPCLVFIDEIDAVGRKRGSGGQGGGNDERENTLNQLLIEMDGFGSTAGIIVLAGTNRADVLDAALIRPGRFDRQIGVDKPDITGREEIFRVHLAPLTLNGGQERAAELANRLAALTPGMTGAEIANVCNEAALIAAREAATSVGMKHLDAAVDRVLGGLEKKSRTQMQRERITVAWHEAGHAVAGWFLPYADPVMKVSIVPRGRAALGYSQSLPREIALYSEEHLEDMVRMALGGRAAEELVLGEVSTGAQNDMERVTNIAQQCVMNFGFSDKVGHVSFGRNDGDSQAMFKPYSEATAQMIDNEVRLRVASSYDAVLELLRSKRPQLDALAERLLAKEVVGVEDLVELLGPRKAMLGDDRYDVYLSKMLRKDEAEPAAPAAPAPPTPSVPAAA
mmetsp:Transcript_32894/g.77163  ORF Transcript_32894/g.77163 Transcript_32894/m.77163 type:complete len:817 (-) Transcript_32894:317-2767(-)